MTALRIFYNVFCLRIIGFCSFVAEDEGVMCGRDMEDLILLKVLETKCRQYEYRDTQIIIS